MTTFPDFTSECSYFLASQEVRSIYVRLAQRHAASISRQAGSVPVHSLWMDEWSNRVCYRVEAPL